ncbi:hypothetical protein Tco_1191318 [Tanacetum coccineum]
MEGKTGKRWHDGCYGGSAVVTRREGLKVAAGGVIWWPTARWRWCKGGDEGDGCDGSMVEGGGTRRRRWQRCLAGKKFRWPESPWRRQIFWRERGG